MPIPQDKDLIAWVEAENAKRPAPVTRRDIARHFGLKGPERAELRHQLKRLEETDQLTLEGKKAKRPGQLPPVAVMQITGTDSEGDLKAVIVNDDDSPVITLPSAAAAKLRPALGVGDRFLGRIEKRGSDFRASVIKSLGKPEGRLLGVFRKSGRAGFIEPVSRKTRTTYEVDSRDRQNADDGDLVWAESKKQRGYGPQRARVLDVVGSVTEQSTLSLIALAEHDIPLEFPHSVINEAKSLRMKPSAAHEDLTQRKLMTIDPASARDHDDAVHAEKLDDGGFRLTVAIADVSYFVRPGSALDKEAEKRGNSVYLPDRVVPMLPEELSNDLCSLKEGQVRLALCCEIEIGAKGGKRKHRFFRAKIKNHKNLAYEAAQAIADGKERGPREVKDLFEAYEVLKVARDRRKPLDLDMPERRIVMENGVVQGIERKERMDAHRLIEEFMVLANVCAAETLSEARRTAIFRVHDAPDPERLDSLKRYLEPLGYTLPKADEIRAMHLNSVLFKAREKDELDILALSVLRSQSQAIYDTENIGHFGLSLKRYAHFTSPIRRYADLTVHRGLVRALGLGEGGEREEDEDRLDTVAETISRTERAAVAAERDTEARLLAAYLEEQTGATFQGRIGGVTKVGLFVTLNETGADGFVPIRTLGWERFEHDEERNRLVSEHSGGAYHLGMPVKVRLVEVTPIQGGLRFEMLTKPKEQAQTEEKTGKSSGRHQKAKRAASRAKGKKAGNRAKREETAPASKKRGGSKPAAGATKQQRGEGKPDKTPAKFARRPRKKR